jgi:hypothetical protein
VIPSHRIERNTDLICHWTTVRHDCAEAEIRKRL